MEVSHVFIDYEKEICSDRSQARPVLMLMLGEVGA